MLFTERVIKIFDFGNHKKSSEIYENEDLCRYCPSSIPTIKIYDSYKTNRLISRFRRKKKKYLCLSHDKVINNVLWCFHQHHIKSKKTFGRVGRIIHNEVTRKQKEFEKRIIEFALIQDELPY
jgi:hypothetical protein